MTTSFRQMPLEVKFADFFHYLIVTLASPHDHLVVLGFRDDHVWLALIGICVTLIKEVRIDFAC